MKNNKFLLFLLALGIHSAVWGMEGEAVEHDPTTVITDQRSGGDTGDTDGDTEEDITDQGQDLGVDAPKPKSFLGRIGDRIQSWLSRGKTSTATNQGGEFGSGSDAVAANNRELAAVEESVEAVSAERGNDFKVRLDKNGKTTTLIDNRSVGTKLYDWLNGKTKDKKMATLKRAKWQLDDILQKINGKQDKGSLTLRDRIKDRAYNAKQDVEQKIRVMNFLNDDWSRATRQSFGDVESYDDEGGGEMKKQKFSSKRRQNAVRERHMRLGSGDDLYSEVTDDDAGWGYADSGGEDKQQPEPEEPQSKVLGSPQDVLARQGILEHASSEEDGWGYGEVDPYDDEGGGENEQ